jgi:hypothetical protein
MEDIFNIDEFIDESLGLKQETEDDKNEVIETEEVITDEDLDAFFNDNSENTVPNEDEGQDNAEEDNTLLDVIKQLGLIDIPDDETELDDDKIKYYVSQTKSKQKNEALSEVRESLKDDYEKSLFDYWAVKSDTKDYPRYQTLLDIVKTYESLDLTEQTNRKHVVSELLKSNLDENNPIHKIKLNKLDKEVEDILSSEDADEIVKQANQFIIKKYNDDRLDELQAAKQREEEIKKEEVKRQADSIKWHNSFKNTVNQLKWEDNKKSEILKEVYETVIDNKGNEMPLWLAKQREIAQNPETYIKFLEWLNSYDLTTKQFKSDANKQDRASTKQIVSLLDKKISKRK